MNKKKIDKRNTAQKKTAKNLKIHTERFKKIKKKKGTLIFKNSIRPK